MLSKLTLIAFLILLTNCAVSGPAPTDSFCATEKPILVGKGDVLTAETSREILAFNTYGARKCGWK